VASGLYLFIISPFSHFPYLFSLSFSFLSSLEQPEQARGRLGGELLRRGAPRPVAATRVGSSGPATAAAGSSSGAVEMRELLQRGATSQLRRRTRPGGARRWWRTRHARRRPWRCAPSGHARRRQRRRCAPAAMRLRLVVARPAQPPVGGRVLKCRSFGEAPIFVQRITWGGSEKKKTYRKEQ